MRSIRSAVAVAACLGLALILSSPLWLLLVWFALHPAH